MKKGTDAAVWALIIISTASILAVDSMTPPGYAEWLVYVLPMWLAFRSVGAERVYGVAALYSLFIAVGFLLSPPGPPGKMSVSSIVNRSLGLTVVWVSAWHVIRTKQARKTAADFEEKMAALVDEARVGAYIIQGARFVFVNRHMSELLGYTASELLSRDVSEFVHPDDRELVKSIIKKRPGGEVSELSYETRVIRKDGTVGYVEILSSVASYGGIPSIIGSVIDITWRRLAAERISLLSAIVESSEDAIIGYDLHGKIKSWNRGAERLYGYTEEEAAGRPLSMLAPPERPDEPMDMINRIMRGERIEHFETAGMRKDGSTVDVSVTVSPMRGPDGRVNGCSSVARDITERKRAEEALRRAHDELDVRVRVRTAELAEANAELESEVGVRRAAEARLTQLNRLCSITSEINRLMLRSTDRTKLFDEACAIAVERGGFVLAWAGLVDEQTGEVKPVASAGRDDGYLSGLDINMKDEARSNGPTGVAIRSGEHFLCNDIEGDPRFAPWRDEALKRGYASSVSFPLAVNKGVVGTFSVYSPVKDFFSGEELRLLDDLAGDIAYCLGFLEHEGLRRQAEDELAGLFKKAEEEAEVSTALLKMVETINSTLDEKDIMRKVIETAPKYLRLDGVSVFLHDGALGGFSYGGGYGMSPSEEGALMSRTFKKDDFPAFGETLAGSMTVINDAAKSPLVTSEMVETFSMGSIVIAPISLRDNVAGAIVGVYRTARTFEKKELSLVKGLADGISIALNNSRLYRKSVQSLMDISAKMETIDAMAQIDRVILSSMDRHSILRTATALINRLIPCDRAAVLLREGDGLRVAAEWGAGSMQDKMVDMHEEGCACFEQEHSARFMADITGKTCGYLDDLVKMGIRSSLILPLRASGGVMGYLDIGTMHPGRLTSEHLSTAEKIAAQITVALENSRLFEDLQQLLVSTIASFASAIDAKSPWTQGHSKRVTRYAVDIGRKMGMENGEVERLRLAGLLHDIGKIGTYDVLLDKPGRLTEEEFAQVKAHPGKGAEILAPIKQLADIIPAILYHHERCDGTGYPEGLKGGDIPLHARILCVADSFDSMTADRPYRKSQGVQYALSEFKRCRGTHFDPEVVDTFLDVLEDLETKAA